MSVKSLGYSFPSGAATPTPTPTPAPIPSAAYPLAARDLSAHRVVILTSGGLDYPTLANMENGDAIVGITTAAANAGSMAAYQFEGRMNDPSWNWIIGPIWCGDGGIMAQAPPNAGKWLRQIGLAVDAQTIEINLFPTYYRVQGS